MHPSRQRSARRSKLRGIEASHSSLVLVGKNVHITLWQRTEDKKQPYFIRMHDERLFGLAGLWERWRTEEGEVIESCSILTTAANEVFRPVHERMPVVLDPESYGEWLDTDTRGVEALKELLRPYPSSEMIAYPVSISINSPRNQGVELIEGTAVNSA